MCSRPSSEGIKLFPFNLFSYLSEERISSEAGELKEGVVNSVNPSFTLLKETQSAFSAITQPVQAGLVESIQDCAAYLMSTDRTEEEKKTSNQWLRKSIIKSELAEISRTGLSKYPKEKTPELVASYMKSLLRSIPGSFIHKSSQNLLIFLMSSGIRILPNR
jgi:hypothetical protein